MTARSETSSWYYPQGSLARANQPVSLDAQTAGWTYCGIDVYDFSSMPKSNTVEIDLANREAVIVPLSSISASVQCNDKKYSLAGRPGVFAAVLPFFDSSAVN